ncbi:putative lipid-A-disaccharide synthase, mitochondrial [Gossypium australe]|uniref:lipid-A-disaccharide synthase n=1 Tax=Gossypium australe TaxID=47621 RepID=A0A5B6UQC6_9ROSI|nr:putative lipid-A-disaccharide synthase, mitochondrial [Gossypium australe]
MDVSPCLHQTWAFVVSKLLGPLDCSLVFFDLQTKLRKSVADNCTRLLLLPSHFLFNCSHRNTIPKISMWLAAIRCVNIFKNSICLKTPLRRYLWVSSKSLLDRAASEGELRVFIVAGEVSGDSIASRLMASLNKISPLPIRFSGVGGSRMSNQGLKSLFPMENIAVMGIWELLPHFYNFRVSSLEPR